MYLCYHIPRIVAKAIFNSLPLGKLHNGMGQGLAGQGRPRYAPSTIAIPVLGRMVPSNTTDTPPAPLYPQRTPRLMENTEDLRLHHPRTRNRKPLSEEQDNEVND